METRSVLSRVVIAGLVVVMATGCTGQGLSQQGSARPTSPALTRRGDIPADVSSLCDVLSAAGIDASAVSATATLPLDSAVCYRVNAGGTTVQVYRFSSSQHAADVASKVSADGSGVPTTAGGLAQVEWKGRPHFFRRDRLIVLYLSARDLSTDDALDTRILRVLRQNLGRQFAGA